MPTLLVLNLYFPPDQAATAQLLGQLSQGLSDTFSITVVCGTPTYHPQEKFRDQDYVGITVHRIPLLPVSRKWMFARLLNYVLFTFGCMLKALTLPTHDIVMCWTDPPWVSFIGTLVQYTKGSKLVLVCQDVYPEILVAAEKMKPSFPFRVLQRLFSFPFARADKVVAIGREMRLALEKKGAPVHRISCISNWQDPRLIRPADKNYFRAQHCIPADAFVVMHSGNIGYSQNLGLLLEAASLLKEHRNILFVLIGDGAAKASLAKKAETLALANTIFLPYQETSTLSQSLSSADLHYVSLLESFSGLIVPSKLYGIMAAGKPVLAVLPEGSSCADEIRAAQCGVLCDPTAEQLSEKILGLSDQPALLATMGASARTYLETTAGKDRAVSNYANLLQELVA